MKVTTLPTPEIGLIAVTRGIAGAGAGLLLAGKMDVKKRRMIAIPMLAIGLLSTIPLIIHAIKNTRDTENGLIGG
jgi:hypothetical protein